MSAFTTRRQQATSYRTLTAPARPLDAMENVSIRPLGASRLSFGLLRLLEYPLYVTTLGTFIGTYNSLR